MTYLHDPTLSWKAKGLLTYLLRTPTAAQRRVAALVAQASDGASAVRAGLRELEDRGYLVRRADRDPTTGQLRAPVLTVVAGTDDADPDDENRTIESQEKSASPHTKNLHAAESHAVPTAGALPPFSDTSAGAVLIAVLGLFIKQIGDRLTAALLEEMTDLVVDHTRDLDHWRAAFRAAAGKPDPWTQVRNAILHPERLVDPDL